jgi:hypothetical protein
VGKSAGPSRPTQPDDPLRGIVGSGGSRVSLDAATRAREVSAPTADDLAAAERAVVLKRAHR